MSALAKPEASGVVSYPCRIPHRQRSVLRLGAARDGQGREAAGEIAKPRGAPYFLFFNLELVFNEPS